jgi:hypothetical protein
VSTPSILDRQQIKVTTTGTAADHSAAEKEPEVSPGRIQIRPLGGGPGCLLMILFSIVASVVLTVVLNLLAR